jgi:antitoxin CptB
MNAMNELLGERELSKLKWRCRRGLLENDLFVERFFRRHEETLTTRQAAGLQVLMDLADNDLLDLLLGRKEPQELADEACDTAEVHEVLALMRAAPAAHRTNAARTEERPLS